MKSEAEVEETAKRLLAQGADAVDVDYAIETAKDGDDRAFWEAVAVRMMELVAEECAREDAGKRT